MEATFYLCLRILLIDGSRQTAQSSDHRNFWHDSYIHRKLDTKEKGQ